MSSSKVRQVPFGSFVIMAIVSPFAVYAQPGGGPPGMASSATLTDECDQSGTSAHYSEVFSDDAETVRLVASDTGCPNHVNWEINPNPAREIPSETNLSSYPMLMADNEVTDLSTVAGAVGIMLNGVSIFSSWARDAATSYDASAFAIEGDTFDLCGGHATTEGWYHYHSTPGCLQEQAMALAGSTADDHSAQIGWSYDGFPVYGQLGPGGVEMLLCGNSLANETYCLDDCSGYEGELSGVDEFKYRYYSSCGFDEMYFPFTTNCFRGCCPDGVTCNENVVDCADDAEDGYTTEYSPAIATNLAADYESELITGTDTEYINTNYYVDCSLYLGSAESSVYEDDSSNAHSLKAVSKFVALFVAATTTTAMLYGGFC